MDRLNREQKRKAQTFVACFSLNSILLVIQFRFQILVFSPHLARFSFSLLMPRIIRHKASCAPARVELRNNRPTYKHTMNVFFFASKGYCSFMNIKPGNSELNLSVLEVQDIGHGRRLLSRKPAWVPSVYLNQGLNYSKEHHQILLRCAALCTIRAQVRVTWRKCR
jgi:hypothetical protein